MPYKFLYAFIFMLYEFYLTNKSVSKWVKNDERKNIVKMHKNMGLEQF